MRETVLKTTRRWKCLKETLWGLVKAECVSTRETSKKNTQRWWFFNERNVSKDYPKVKDFIKRNLFKDYSKVRSLLVMLDHWNTNQGFKRTEEFPHCRLFRSLDFLNSRFNALGRSPLTNVETLGHNCTKNCLNDEFCVVLLNCACLAPIQALIKRDLSFS